MTNASGGSEGIQSTNPPYFKEMSDQERARVIDQIDHKHGSRVKRHEKKAAAIPQILRAGESLHFLTDAHLWGTFLLVHDLFAVTDSRVLVIRDDRKRVDEYDLSQAISLAAKEPIAEGKVRSTPMTFTFPERELKALIYSTTAAIPFIHISYRVASYLRSQSGRHAPELNVPYELDSAIAGNNPTMDVIDTLRVPSDPLPLVGTDGEVLGEKILRNNRRWTQNPPGLNLSRAQMVEMLIRDYGAICAGCDREFEDPLYLELDHVLPRSDGGSDHISNRLLLCGPCNRIKGNRLTLSGLRAENNERGRMAKQGPTAP